MLLTDNTLFHTHYYIGSAINCGRYGVVYKVNNKLTKKQCAVKILPKYRHDISNKSSNEMIYNESMCWQILNGKPNIVELIDIYEDIEHVYFVQQLYEHTLYEYLTENSNNVVGLQKMIFIIYNILLGIQACHDSNILHGDVKPNNILMDTTSKQLCLCDFGSARILPSTVDSNKLRGTPYYISPEALTGTNTFSRDIWAIGIIAFMMLYKKHPFLDTNYNNNTVKNNDLNKNSLLPILLDTELTLPDTSYDKLKMYHDFISCCLVKHYDKRISVHDALAHPLFTLL